MSLKELIAGIGHGKLPQYFDMYSDVFAGFTNKPIRFLEIGVADGKSLKTWKQYFPLADIWGLDIDPDCLKYKEDRIKIIIGDQRDKELLERLPPFDIIVDDGGHMMDMQQISFEVLYPNLNPGGWYFIEDLWFSYGLAKESYYRSLTTMDFLKKCIDCIHIQKGHKDYQLPYLITEMRFINGLVGIKK